MNKEHWSYPIQTKLGKILYVLMWFLMFFQAWVWSDEYFPSEEATRNLGKDTVTLILFFIVIIVVVELVGWPLRAWRRKQDRELEELVAAEAWRKKKKIEEEARLDEIRARKRVEDAIRPIRMERDIAEIKEQLLRIASGQPTKKPKEEPRANPSFSGAIKTEKQALEVMDLKHPFTASELKKRRASLLQKTHPDQGGSTMLVRLVNEAYDILKTKV